MAAPSEKLTSNAQATLAEFAIVKKLLSPVVASFRAPTPRVLAFMADGSRRLLSGGAKVEMRSFPAGSPLSIDHDRFESSLLAQVTIEDFTGVINGVDVKALTRAVAAGELTDPELQKLARAHARYSSSILSNQEVSTLRDQQGLAEELGDPIQ